MQGKQSKSGTKIVFKAAANFDKNSHNTHIVYWRSKVNYKWWLKQLKFWKTDEELIIDFRSRPVCKTGRRIRLFSLLDHLIYKPKYTTLDEYRYNELQAL